jgi:hypothetical protein
VIGSGMSEAFAASLRACALPESGMTRLHTLPARRRPLHPTLRAAGAVGLACALMLSLAACKGDETSAMSPAGAALVASAPAVAAARVPPPPAIQPVATTSNTSSDLASVDAQLETTLSRASACTVDTECHSVAIGAKACGGPTGYRAYSSKSVSTASVDALAQHERDLAAQAARESHEVSTCIMLADPGAHCERNKCVTGPAGMN